MSTLLQFAKSVADACAELEVTTVTNPAQNAKFVRLLLSSVDDALSHLSTFHQWEWLVRTVIPTTTLTTLIDAIRVRDVTYKRRRLPYREVGIGDFEYPTFTFNLPNVAVLGLTTAQLADVEISYESSLFSIERSDFTVLPVPQEFEYGLREYVLYLLHVRHVNDAKRAQMHLQNALSAYDLLKSRRHGNRQTFNRYTGVNR
jgi:hypothetical protein